MPEDSRAESNDYQLRVMDRGGATVIIRYDLGINGPVLGTIHVARRAYEAFIAQVASGVPGVPQVPAGEHDARLAWMRRDLLAYLASDAGRRHVRGIYGDVRKSLDWPALDAWRFAARLAATVTAVQSEYISFSWEPDSDDCADPDDDGETARKLESGEWRREWCGAFIVPEHGHSGSVPDASLGSIITGYDDAGTFYRHEIECQLAEEAGVLPDLPSPWSRP